MANEEAAKAKLARMEESQAAGSPTAASIETFEMKLTVDAPQTPTHINHASIMMVDENKENTTNKNINGSAYFKTGDASLVNTDILAAKDAGNMDDKPSSPLRRGSQESTATNTTQTTTTTGSDTTTSSSSESSSSDSSSSETDDSSSEDGEKVLLRFLVHSLSFLSIFQFISYNCRTRIHH